jgi:hypothetical protein
MAKYLSERQLLELIGEISLPPNFSTMSQDSYNETMVGEKIKKLKNPPELLASAVNLSLVGYGNKKLGQYRDGETIISIQQVCIKHGVLYQNEQGALLKENDLTPQRLCRFFRHHIRNHIIQTGQSSYLWRKYSTRDESMKSICFRGAEYLDDLTDNQAKYLLDTIKNMDNKLGTHIQERIIRVFEAKGYKVV